jgi:xylulokinase
MLEQLGIREDQLPEIRESGEAVAPLLPEIARELGLTTNLMICTGALDQSAGAMGVGNVREGMISENIGAALAICVPVNKPVFDPNQQMPLHYFPLPDTYMIHTFTNGGMTLRWFRDLFCQAELNVGGLSGMDAYDIIGKEAAQVPPGSDGLIMLPHLAGSLAPDVKSSAKGVFYGFTLLHKKGHFARAIMESLAYIVRRNLEVLEGMGIQVSEIRSLGGGSKSPVWNQIKADVLGCKLMTMTTKEAACLGAAILAGKAVGLFPSVYEAIEGMSHVKEEFFPNSEIKPVYDRCFAGYKDLFKSLDGMFDQY